MSDKQQPFSGLLVVSVEQAVAAPLCASRLADGGARVIKVERPEGDFARQYDTTVKGESAYFVWANHGKESLQLNLKDPADAALLHRMITRADIFIQNLAPGAIARAGFCSDQLRAKHPRLITCDISGYGDTGSYRDMKAYDFLVQCESGLVTVSGAPPDYGRIGVSLCDIGAGMNALIGIQQALLMRTHTGQGSGVKVSLFDTAADWMTVPLMQAQYTGNSPVQMGMHHPSIAPYGGYLTADNKTLVIAVQNEREWKLLCENILEKTALTTDPRFKSNLLRVTNRKTLNAIIGSAFANKDRATMVSLLTSAGIAYGAVNSVDDVINHPQLRRRWVTLASGDQAELIAPPCQMSYENKGQRYQAVPYLGQHSELIREEFGGQHDCC